jgi:TRAP-type mannitol/chloroaromatic compound transport system permease small subunit
MVYPVEKTVENLWKTWKRGLDMGWQFYWLSAIVALLGMTFLALTTVIQIMLRVEKLLARRIDEELKHIFQSEVIVQAEKKEKPKPKMPSEPRI